MVTFSMAEIICRKKDQFQRGWNVSWSKSSVSACLKWVVVKNAILAQQKYVVQKTISFSITKMCCVEIVSLAKMCLG
jgi:hypothetical protein